MARSDGATGVIDCRRAGGMVRRGVVWGVVATLFIAGAASAVTFGSNAGPPSSPAGPLRALAAPHGISLGAAVDAEALENDPVYGATLARELSMVTPENVMKWRTIHPEPARYDFTAADRLVKFATRHGMRVRGHTLVWHIDNPTWLTEGSFTRHQLSAILRDHIKTVVGHFRGRIAQWDVVNEAISDDGTLRETVWSRGIGPSYIDRAFRWAHAADPEAKLFYNDYGGEGRGVKADAIYRLVAGMRRRGVPIDGVGLQMHTAVGEAPRPKDVVKNMRRIAGLSLGVAVTEMDVAVAVPAAASSLSRQARVYGDGLSACLLVRRCTAFVTWGFTDRYSWIPTSKPGLGDALPFDANYELKPAYEALRRALDVPTRRRGS